MIGIHTEMHTYLDRTYTRPILPPTESLFLNAAMTIPATSGLHAFTHARIYTQHKEQDTIRFNKQIRNGKRIDEEPVHHAHTAWKGLRVPRML